MARERADLAVTAERNRIAREMHDVVAHSLSVIVVQADGGRYAARSDPEAAVRALDTIADTARRALSDSRRVLGLLRTDDSAVQLSPVAEVEAIGALVAQVRALGLGLAHVQTGSPRALPPGPGMAVYRVCQESLTNVIKHAGPTARATVSESWLPDRLRLVVSNTPAAGQAAYGLPESVVPGHGLVGMRERAEVFGGQLTVGRTSEGGFRVQLDLPYPDQDAWPGPGRGDDGMDEDSALVRPGDQKMQEPVGGADEAGVDALGEAQDVRGPSVGLSDDRSYGEGDES